MPFVILGTNFVDREIDRDTLLITFLNNYTTKVTHEYRREVINEVISIFKSRAPNPSSISPSDVLRAIAKCKTGDGVPGINLTDTRTRKFLLDSLYFCGRFEIIATEKLAHCGDSILLQAHDHGLYFQVYKDILDDGTPASPTSKKMNRNHFIEAVMLIGSRYGEDVNEKVRPQMCLSHI